MQPAEGLEETGAVAVVQIPVQVTQGYGQSAHGLGPVAAGDPDDGAALGVAGPREPDVAVERATGALQPASGGGEQPISTSGSHGTEASRRRRLKVELAVVHDEMVELVDKEMVKLKRFNDGDIVVITAGSPPGVPGTTNMVRVHHLGEGARD